ncbi:hypothetical protein WJX79_006035 [Trebouxia sp. C0005]
MNLARKLEQADQVELPDRDEHNLSFRKVVSVQLQADTGSKIDNSPALLATASAHGPVCIATAAGVYVVTVQDLTALAKDFDVQQAARAIIPTQADGILFSCDSSLLAFVWSPSNPQQSVVVLELGQLYTGLLRNKLQPVHSNRIVACVAWSPDGQMLALAVEQQVIVWDLQQHAEGFQTSIQIQDEDLGEYLVDSVLWTSPTSILTCLGPAEDSGLALAAMLTWDDHSKIYEVPTNGSAPTLLFLEDRVVLDAQEDTLDNFITGDMQVGNASGAFISFIYTLSRQAQRPS